MACPCPDEACEDVHAHDVTGEFVIQLPELGLLIGQAAVPGGE